MSFIRHIDDDLEIETMPGEVLKLLTKREEAKGKNKLPFSSVYDIVVEANYHYHANHHEKYFVTEGEGIVVLDGIPYRIRKGHLIYINPGTKHLAKKFGVSLELQVDSIPPWNPKDYHMVEMTEEEKTTLENMISLLQK